jgi:hypothetical protein
MERGSHTAFVTVGSSLGVERRLNCCHDGACNADRQNGKGKVHGKKTLAVVTDFLDGGGKSRVPTLPVRAPRFRRRFYGKAKGLIARRRAVNFELAPPRATCVSLCVPLGGDYELVRTKATCVSPCVTLGPKPVYAPGRQIVSPEIRTLKTTRKKDAEE